jgi:hypothetical protein
LWQFSQPLSGFDAFAGTLNLGFVAGAVAFAWHAWQYVRSALAVAPCRLPGSHDVPVGCATALPWHNEPLKHPGGDAGSNAGVGAGTPIVLSRFLWHV